MIVVVASRHDAACRSLVERWTSHGALLLVPDDFCRAGWRYYSDDPQRGTAVIGGEVVPTQEITAVLTRLAAVPCHELARIDPDEREYVAAEMTAFLRAWLSELRCPVLNRPTAQCLAGPGWRPAEWTHLADRLAIPVRRVCHEVGRPREVAAAAVTPQAPESGEVNGTPVDAVTVLGSRCLQSSGGIPEIHAKRLARAAQVDFVTARFTGPALRPRFVDANPWPDLSDSGTADALLDYFAESSRFAASPSRAL